MSRLDELAALLRRKNAVDTEIASVIGRPALMGHVGEYIAAEVFDIRLENSASSKALDGYFRSGPLAGRSVNVKWTAKHEGLLDLSVDLQPDFYLILAGPKSPPGPSRGGVRPWIIRHVFLFESEPLIAELRARETRIGVATSVRAHQWANAELYPEPRNTLLSLSNEQRRSLDLFA